MNQGGKGRVRAANPTLAALSKRKLLRGRRRLVVGAQATRADGQPHWLAADVERRVLNVRHPTPLGVALRVTYVVAMRRLLPTNVAPCSHEWTPY